MYEPRDLNLEFWTFHRNNPHVYDLLVQLAREAVAAGHKTAGIGMLYEVVRWHYFIKTTDDDFKLNNDYRAFYARLIMKQEEDLDGIFNLRRSIADDDQPIYTTTAA